jgi:hypothetical protein
MIVAEMIQWACGLYNSLGFVIGVLFVCRGVERVDASAVGASWGFRLILLPGSVALWPLIAVWWIRGRSEGIR